MNNEEKILELLERMQGDISDLKTGQAETNVRLDKMEANLAKLEADMVIVKEDLRFTKDTAIIMENDYGDQLKGMWDAYSAVKDKLDEHSVTLSRIELKLDNLEIRVGVHDFQLKAINT